MTGQRLGPFQILQKLGSGSYATTYLAFNTHLGTRSRFVLKIPHTPLKAPKDIHRFFQGARLAAGIHHPNVVQIFDVFKDKETYFIAMEYIVGESLEQHLARNPQMPAEGLCQLAMQVASGFEAIHEAGVIHRDLKPENILIREEPHLYVAKIIDFGISLEIDTDTFLVEMTGTPLYVAPEICCGDPPTQLGDIYSFGILLYEMFAGRPPFFGDSVESILLQQVTEKAPPLPRRFAAPIQREWEALIHLMIQKLPQERIQTMTEVQERLKHIHNLVKQERDPSVSQTVDPTLHKMMVEMQTEWKRVQSENHQLHQLLAQEERQHCVLKSSYDSLLSLYETTRQLNSHQATQEERLLSQLQQVEEEKRLLQQRLQELEQGTTGRLTTTC